MYKRTRYFYNLEDNVFYELHYDSGFHHGTGRLTVYDLKDGKKFSNRYNDYYEALEFVEDFWEMDFLDGIPYKVFPRECFFKHDIDINNNSNLYDNYSFINKREIYKNCIAVEDIIKDCNSSIIVYNWHYWNTNESRIFMFRGVKKRNFVGLPYYKIISPVFEVKDKYKGIVSFIYKNYNLYTVSSYIEKEREDRAKEVLELEEKDTEIKWEFY